MTRTIRRTAALVLLAATALAPLAARAQADSWPSKPVRIIVPANAGGGTANPVSRFFAEELTKHFNGRFFIENHGGANGNIGAAIASKAPNDGYTVLFSWAGTLATNISLYPSLNWHPVRDFDPSVLVGGVSNILVVNNDFPARTLKEFTEHVRRNPGKFNYGSSGNGSSMHLAAELYKQQTKTFIVHVPYNNIGQGTLDLVGGQLQMMFQLVTGVQGFIANKQVRPIAILAAKRSPVLPDVPTMAELGMPIESQTWFAFLFPKGAPPQAVQRLNEAVNKILADPAARQRLIGMGVEPGGGTPQDLAKHLESEIVKWRSVVQFSGAKIE